MAAAIGMTSALGLLAGCGGSSAVTQPMGVTTTTGASEAVAAHATPGTAAPGAARGRERITTGVRTYRPLHGTGGDEVNDDNPGHADQGSEDASAQSDPCSLVTRAEAQGILGGTVQAPAEAPLGPTCIYQRTGARTFVGLAISPGAFTAIEPHVRRLRRLSIDGRRAYCGGYGQPTVFVPLASGGMLTVTGPCAVGKLFARSALLRVGVPDSTS